MTEVLQQIRTNQVKLRRHFTYFVQHMINHYLVADDLFALGLFTGSQLQELRDDQRLASGRDKGRFIWEIITAQMDESNLRLVIRIFENNGSLAVLLDNEGVGGRITTLERTMFPGANYNHSTFYAFLYNYYLDALYQYITTFTFHYFSFYSFLFNFNSLLITIIIATLFGLLVLLMSGSLTEEHDEEEAPQLLNN